MIDGCDMGHEERKFFISQSFLVNFYLFLFSFKGLTSLQSNLEFFRNTAVTNSTWDSENLNFSFKSCSNFKSRDSFGICSSYCGKKLVLCDILTVLLIYRKVLQFHQLSQTLNILAKILSISTCMGCFEILRTSRFQNCPWTSNQRKI